MQVSIWRLPNNFAWYLGSPKCNSSTLVTTICPSHGIEPTRISLDRLSSMFSVTLATALWQHPSPCHTKEVFLPPLRFITTLAAACRGHLTALVPKLGEYLYPHLLFETVKYLVSAQRNSRKYSLLYIENQIFSFFFFFSFCFVLFCVCGICVRSWVYLWALRYLKKVVLPMNKTRKLNMYFCKCKAHRKEDVSDT